jgi:tetratricopeptide (TPR) repeat protein
MTYRASFSRIVSRSGVVLFVGVAALALAAEPAFAQMGTGRMQGQVTDPEGNGLEGVQITAHNPDVTPSTIDGTSGSGGRWAIIGFARGNWTFTFRLDGYVAYEVAATVSAANRNPNLDVTLNPIPEGAGAAGAGAGATQPELFNEGTALFAAGDYAGAVAKWQEFVAVNPTMFQVYGNIGNAYRELGDIDNARSAYESLLAEEPGNTMANYNLGEMLVEAGDVQAAMPYFETVVESSPDDPAVYYNVAELYFSERELEPAIIYYKRAIEVDPNYLPAHKQLGFAYVNTNDIPNAILAFEKYVELAPPDDPELPVIQDVLAALRNG